MKKEETSQVYQHEIIEFVTVAVQYCAYLELSEGKSREEYVDTLLKILPLLYLKGALLPKYELLTDYAPSDYVTEENYDIVRNNISYVMSDKDDYLDVFVEDMKYSDTPILTSVSENLADIYQDIKNFVCAYRDGDEDNRYNAVATCKDAFVNFWGQKLTNVMRALHDVRYSDSDYEDEFED